MFNKFASVFFSIALVGNGVAAIVSDRFILRACRRGCTIESIMFVLFGNEIGKSIIGGSFIVMGALVFWIGFMPMKNKDVEESESD